MSEATNNYSNLSDQTKFRLNEINKIKDYFNGEIQERKNMSKKLTRYIAIFGYFDKNLIVLSATSERVSIISFSSITGVAVRIASASFSLIFSLTTGIRKNLLKITRNKKKKHNQIVTLARSKLNSIEKLISQALIDLEISNKEFKTIVDKKEKYEKMKENIRMIKSQKVDELKKDELNEQEGEKIETNKIIRENNENA